MASNVMLDIISQVCQETGDQALSWADTEIARRKKLERKGLSYPLEPLLLNPTQLDEVFGTGETVVCVADAAFLVGEKLKSSSLPPKVKKVLSNYDLSGRITYAIYGLLINNYGKKNVWPDGFHDGFNIRKNTLNDVKDLIARSTVNIDPYGAVTITTRLGPAQIGHSNRAEQLISAGR